MADLSEIRRKAWRTRRKQAVDKVKDTARSYANVYKRRGKIEPEPCEMCGEPAQMHHEDYGKPLQVRWLCRSHHMQLHDHGCEPKVPQRHPKHRLTPRKARAA